MILQGVAAYCDGYFSQRQMQSRGITNGYSFLQHGGMWADMFIVSPAVALIASKYKINYFSLYGIVFFAGTFIVVRAMGRLYCEYGKIIPEAHTHDGRTTLAGWIHGIFAFAVIWECLMFYLSPTVPKQKVEDLIFVSFLLTLLFPLGVIKFSLRWKFSLGDYIQIGVLTLLVWSVTASYIFVN